MPDVKHIGEIVLDKPIHQSRQQPVGRQGRGTVRDECQRVSPVLLSQTIDHLGKFVAGRLRREIQPGRDLHPT